MSKLQYLEILSGMANISSKVPQSWILGPESLIAVVKRPEQQCKDFFIQVFRLQVHSKVSLNSLSAIPELGSSVLYKDISIQVLRYLCTSIQMSEKDIQMDDSPAKVHCGFNCCVEKLSFRSHSSRGQVGKQVSQPFA